MRDGIETLAPRPQNFSVAVEHEDGRMLEPAVERVDRPVLVQRNPRDVLGVPVRAGKLDLVRSHLERQLRRGIHELAELLGLFFGGWWRRRLGQHHAAGQHEQGNSVHR